MAAALYTLAAVLVVLVCLAGANDVNRERIYNRQFGERERESKRASVEAGPLIFDQTLDHFAPYNHTTTFPQRFFVNNTFYKGAGSPAFMIIGGEGELSASSVLSGAVVSYAQQYGAILFALEHRYYGESVPFPNLDSDALQYLTINQALGDLVNFQANMITQYNLSSNTKWAFFGCSYSGAMAAWFRLKYPHLVWGSLAGSAPVEAILSFYQYDQVIGQSLGATCAESVHNATLQLQELLLDNATNADIRERLGCSEVTDNVAVLYVLADTIAYAVQYSHAVSQVCANFTNSTDLVDTYVNFVNFIYNTTGTSCVSFDISSFTNTTVNPEDNMRQWMWQSCNELGYFQTAPANNSVRSTLINVEWHLQVCEKLFNGAANEPRVAWTNEFFGGDNIATSNTVFTNGALDPWQILSVLQDRSASVPSIMIPGVAHCANWRGQSASDSQALIDARNEVSAYIGAFLDSCDSSTNNAGCGANGLCTFNNVNNSVTSLCACTNGFTGALCDTQVKPEDKDSTKSIPWWSLIIVGGGAALVFALLGGLIGSRVAKRNMYATV